MNKDSKEMILYLKELHEIIEDENVLKSDILESIWKKTKSGKLVWIKSFEYNQYNNHHMTFCTSTQGYNINLYIYFGDYKYRNTILEICIDFYEQKRPVPKFATDRFLFKLHEYTAANNLYEFLINSGIKVDPKEREYVNKPTATRFNKPKVDTVEDHVRKVVDFS